MPTVCSEENPGPQEQGKINQYSRWLPIAAGSNGHPKTATRKPSQELVCPNG